MRDRRTPSDDWLGIERDIRSPAIESDSARRHTRCVPRRRSSVLAQSAQSSPPMSRREIVEWTELSCGRLRLMAMADVVACLAINGHNVLVSRGNRRRAGHPAGARTTSRSRIWRSWWDTADSLMPMVALRSQTQSSTVSSAATMRSRVGSAMRPRSDGELREVVRCGWLCARACRTACEMNDAFVAIVLGKRGKLILFAWSCHGQSPPKLYMNSYSGVYLLSRGYDRRANW